MKSIICLSSPSRILFLFSCFIIFFTTTTISASYDGNETDHLALLSFKSMITHDPYGALSSWNTSLYFCDWNGVTCGRRHKRVTVLRLRSQGLEGSLSPHVGNLSFLRELRLFNNSFQGSIPREIGRLSRLRILVLEENKFNGSILSNLSGCSNLNSLMLGANELVGCIPKEISLLSKLTVIAVGYNNLTGGIPPFLGNMTSMEGFSTVGNPLGGSIPDTLGQMKTLRIFSVGECKLYGTIPRSIYNLSRLAILSFPYNQVNGSLLPAIGTRLPHLLWLQIAGNQLTGPIPSSISNCSQLQILEMRGNRFSGKLKIDFAGLNFIRIISLGNQAYGRGEDDSMKFINSTQNCSRLQILVLHYFKSEGGLPRSIGNLSDQLRFLNLERNQLHGNLPSSIGNLVGLKTLRIGGNEFTGNIPSTIGMLPKLQTASLLLNQFSGTIPDSIGNLSSLINLYLGSNRLEGRIPSSLGSCHKLSDLDLNDNKLSGLIPKQLLQLSSLSITLNLSRNNLSGSIPTEIGNLKMLSNMDLSYNNLSGKIPISLGGCASLVLLSLKGNLFQGIIPQSLSSLRGLEVLDLSQNNLSGQIPQFFDRFSLKFINLSFNHFEGEVPVKGVFANASAISILGNNRLCGGLRELGLHSCKQIEKHKKKFPLFVIVLLAASTLFTIICLAYVWCKKKNKSNQSQSSRNEQFLKVSFSQLFKATDGFSKANLIGQGGFSSVYRGILDDDDRFVAVKVLHLQNRGGQRSFIRECEAWRNIRHRNLLKIITSCSSVDFQGNDFKALVYEFMPNGSLYDWLHSNIHTSKLNLLQRINILIDVASALDYLHNLCVTTIVHCDLKPSNILLDDDMVAHVGDFGLARFLETDSNQNNSTGVKGTIGYAHPEYGMGNEMTSSGDVYSFGILLLEVMTGKTPTNDIFMEGLSLHKFASNALPDHVIDIIENDVIVMQSTEANANKVECCLASIVKIGVSCSLDSPAQRMNIGNVIHELQHILNALQNIEEKMFLLLLENSLCCVLFIDCNKLGLSLLLNAGFFLFHDTIRVFLFGPEIE